MEEQRKCFLEPGKIYHENGKSVLVFGVAKRPTEVGTFYDGIGIDLETGKVEQVYEFSHEVYKFSELNPTQLENFSHFYSIYRRMSNKGVIAISGKARSGKDTLADKIIESGYNVRKAALGDPIKDIYRTLYGEMVWKDRLKLILIGQGLREKDPHIWVKVWLRKAVDCFAYHENVRIVVPDVRQPNEFSFFQSLGAQTVLIKADEEKRREILRKVDGEKALDEKLLNDETELHVDTFDADFIIFNNYDEKYEEEMIEVIERLQ